MSWPAIPNRLHHEIPSWVPDGSPFHIRIALEDRLSMQLVESPVALPLLQSFARYHREQRWSCDLVLLMPEHLHAILSFPPGRSMSQEVSNWKRGGARHHALVWQDGYFDHRLRSPASVTEKWWYIRRNPVVKNLCAHEDSWPHWWSPHIHGDDIMDI